MQSRLTSSSFGWILASVALFLALACIAAAAPASNKNEYFAYVGTYTEEGSESKGIYAYRFNSATGQMTPLGLAAHTINPSFLAVHPKPSLPLRGE